MHNGGSQGAIKRGVDRRFGFGTKVEITGILIAGGLDRVAFLHVELCEKFSGIGSLRKRDGSTRILTGNVETEELRRSSKIANFEILAEFRDDPIDLVLCLGADEAVVDVGANDYRFVG